MTRDRRAFAMQLYRAALDAVDPSVATRVAVAALPPSSNPVAVLALGKAAHRMTQGALDALAVQGVTVASGLVVAERTNDAVPPWLTEVVGDHPVPGAGSRRAADALEEWVQALPVGADVLVLLSGGTTSLLAAPVPGITNTDLVRLFELLLASGTDIRTMNAVRKRILRWGAGRLATALAPRRVYGLAISDVLGDDPSVVGSGPLSPDSLTAAKVRRMLERAGLVDRIPGSVRDYLDRVHHQADAETPKPGARVFANVAVTVLLSNAAAVTAAAHAAREAGAVVRIIRESITGEASRVGRELAARLVAWRQKLQPSEGVGVTVAGGETTVTLGDASGTGGRCQELALAAAAELHRLRPRSEGITLLAAGTDGRDGPGEAAGAVVDAFTWERVRAAGRSPADDLAHHDSGSALHAVGALCVTGPTGTNVNDLLIAVADPPA